MKLYLSGPMTGIPGHNSAVFYEAEKMLRSAGYEVVNPARVVIGPNATWLTYMRNAMKEIADVDGIAQLEDWHKSHGARLEASWASSLGIPAVGIGVWILVGAKK